MAAARTRTPGDPRLGNRSIRVVDEDKRVAFSHARGDLLQYSCPECSSVYVARSLNAAHPLQRRTEGDLVWGYQ